MAEIIIDNENGEVRVTGTDKPLVIKAENAFVARLYNERFVWVETDANTPDEKQTLYDPDGNVIYEMYSRQQRLVFMGREVETDYPPYGAAYYPPKKQLVVGVSQRNENGELRGGLRIYSEDLTLVKTFDDPCRFDKVVAVFRNRYTDEFEALHGFDNCEYRICGGIRCSDDNTVSLRLQPIGKEIVCGDWITWNTELDMNTFVVRVVGYDPR